MTEVQKFFWRSKTAKNYERRNATDKKQTNEHYLRSDSWMSRI